MSNVWPKKNPKKKNETKISRCSARVVNDEVVL